jgi:transposase
VEGCNGIGRHVAQRLVADGEKVLDVPAKLAARVRVFDTGNGGKTDPADAHSVAVVALRAPGLTQVRPDEDLVALRLLADRCDELARTRTQTANRLHRLLLELIPGGAPPFLSAIQARTLLSTIRPRDVAGRIRRQLAAELLTEIVVLDRKLKDGDKRLREAVAATGTGLLDLYGIGPAGAARLLGDIADVNRFADRARFASWNGTAPLDASSGDQHRHRLSRAGNRRINRVLHIMAIVQIRHDTPGRAYYRRRLAEGKQRWKRCAASNADCPTWSTGRWPPTRRRRVRQGKRGGLRSPARPARSPRPTLRNSHNPDPPPSLPTWWPPKHPHWPPRHAGAGPRLPAILPSQGP